MERVTVSFEGEGYDFDLDPSTKKWTAIPNAYEPLDEGDFPLVAELGGKRYELYDDGTFGEEELP